MMTGLTLMNYRRILMRSIAASWHILLRGLCLRLDHSRLVNINTQNDHVNN